jgi:hypothetical protein
LCGDGEDSKRNCYGKKGFDSEKAFLNRNNARVTGNKRLQPPLNKNLQNKTTPIANNHHLKSLLQATNITKNQSPSTIKNAARAK